MRCQFDSYSNKIVIVSRLYIIRSENRNKLSSLIVIINRMLSGMCNRVRVQGNFLVKDGIMGQFLHLPLKDLSEL